MSNFSTPTSSALPSGAATPTGKPALRILMLHGFTQSGPLFHAKTRALEKNLVKAFPTHYVTLSYPTAPIRLSPADIPNFGTASNGDAESGADREEPDAWGWWVRKGEKEPFTYEGMEAGFARIAEVLGSEGPFDGVVGFSQGGACAGMLASLLEPGRREAFEAARSRGGMEFPASLVRDTGDGDQTVHPPLKFAVSYSGFGASNNPLYQAFYEPKIRTAMLHFLGTLDTVVEESRSLRLVDACADGGGEGRRRVVYHPGGHFLPSSAKPYVGALVGFIREVLESQSAEDKKEKAEDMDVPF
ncbi:hypothetical protein W97_05682 [Coniosporium apollinis CBS 100218]|uniref:Serine hydrolase domain-containing protein n=1 Tax=Coniosporium apollinis (strain CBS 100218) TaxID=1168221 RepID=R7YWV2_CONA1|nr:uncharacterized protein W97_05682 [Coniosporium apollinis CBS 100218]EON66289.1 hypothetical protein W97_05682 [Coniosporium apollinis CBS 100218]